MRLRMGNLQKLGIQLRLSKHSYYFFLVGASNQKSYFDLEFLLWSSFLCGLKLETCILQYLVREQISTYFTFNLIFTWHHFDINTIFKKHTVNFMSNALFSSFYSHRAGVYCIETPWFTKFILDEFENTTFIYQTHI